MAPGAPHIADALAHAILTRSDQWGADGRFMVPMGRSAAPGLRLLLLRGSRCTQVSAAAAAGQLGTEGAALVPDLVWLLLQHGSESCYVPCHQTVSVGLSAIEALERIRDPGGLVMAALQRVARTGPIALAARASSALATLQQMPANQEPVLILWIHMAWYAVLLHITGSLAASMGLLVLLTLSPGRCGEPVSDARGPELAPDTAGQEVGRRGRALDQGSLVATMHDRASGAGSLLCVWAIWLD